MRLSSLKLEGGPNSFMNVSIVFSPGEQPRLKLNKFHYSTTSRSLLRYSVDLCTDLEVALNLVFVLVRS